MHGPITNLYSSLWCGRLPPIERCLLRLYINTITSRHSLLILNPSSDFNSDPSTGAVIESVIAMSCIMPSAQPMRIEVFAIVAS